MLLVYQGKSKGSVRCKTMAEGTNLGEDIDVDESSDEENPNRDATNKCLVPYGHNPCMDEITHFSLYGERDLGALLRQASTKRL
jgi:hypothetical protein